MKKCLMLCALASFIMLVSSCVEVATNWKADLHPANYTTEYCLSKVLESDPVNVSGIDVMPHFEFFNDYRMTLYIESGKISAVEFNEGSVPFSAYGFSLPEGKVPCHFDGSVLPNVLRLESGEVFATLYKGQFQVEFHLDNPEVSYKYFFQAAVETPAEE